MVDQSVQRDQIQSFRTAPGEAGGASPVTSAHGQTTTRRNGGPGPTVRGPGPTVGGNGRVGFEPHRASTGELVSQAAAQLTTLVRSELALGKAELVAKGKKVALGGAMLAAAGLFSLYALGLLVTLFVVVLDFDWPLWLAVLVVLLVLGVLTLGLAGLGISRLRAAASPPQTPNRVRDDLRSIKDAIRDGRANHQAGHDGRPGS